jgi:hypothetical protein
MREAHLPSSLVLQCQISQFLKKTGVDQLGSSLEKSKVRGNTSLGKGATEGGENLF